ncbi:MAG: VWA domain-containing protein [Acidobacteria bacterium]|nr:VWA domain-containing protein [Acidobacteriota bacterium]
MWRRAGGLLLAASVCITAAATRPPQTFKSDTDLVVLHVNVFNDRSDAVPDLPQQAFQVFEDDEPQEITFFTSGEVPVAVGLVLDGSSSMIGRHGMVLTSGDAFIRTTRPEDELFTILFNEHVQFGLPPDVPFTSHPTLLRAALARYRAGGRTALHDAVIAALDHLERATHQKRVLVVLSDGKDNASRHSKREMLERVRRNNAIVYTVSNAHRLNGQEANPRVLRGLAEASGGVAYFPDSDEEVVESLDDIAGNVRRGYLIGYVPRNAAHDGAYRRVKVTVRAPGRSKLTARSREGYEAHAH